MTNIIDGQYAEMETYANGLGSDNQPLQSLIDKHLHIDHPHNNNNNNQQPQQQQHHDGWD